MHASSWLSSITFLVLAQSLLVLGHGGTRSCNRNEFKCDNGDCIKNLSPCDGVKDCKDGSDETRELCLDLRCPVYTFKCDYGACISSSLKCNGDADCHDGSDEKCGQGDNITNKGSESACKESEFFCKKGKNCIDSFLVCNAKRDCSDGSDETADVCKGASCGEFSFQCRYGACIDRLKKCDGTKDCPDGSDEDSITCERVIKPTFKGCRLPEKPSGGRYEVRCPSGRICPTTPGQILSDGALVYSCHPGYTLSTNSISFCIRNINKWSLQPYCYRNCTGLISRSVDMSCTYKGVELKSCTGEVLPETQARVRCKTHYRNDLAQQYLVCQKNGTWNQVPFKCKPRCGEPLSNLYEPLLSYGNHTDSREHPWQVLMYIRGENNSYEVACGGTIISADFVLTAAHCLFIQGTQYKFLKPEVIKIAVGKYNSTWNYQDVYEQRFSVKKVIVPNDYRDEDTFYVHDIALLQLKKDIEFNRYVMPACLDCNNRLTFKSGERATIAGWGRDEYHLISKVLKVAQLPYLTYQDCSKVIDSMINKFLTSDKFCVEYNTVYNNGSSPGLAGVQQGDSGGGLTIVNKADQLHYVFGVVSIKDNIKTSMALFTNVSLHMNWIKKHIGTEVGGCNLK